MYYINTKQNGKKQTVASFDNATEANIELKNYKFFGSFYLSNKKYANNTVSI